MIKFFPRCRISLNQFNIQEKISTKISTSAFFPVEVGKDLESFFLEYILILFSKQTTLPQIQGFFYRI